MRLLMLALTVIVSLLVPACSRSADLSGRFYVRLTTGETVRASDAEIVIASATAALTRSLDDAAAQFRQEYPVYAATFHEEIAAIRAG
jgi:ABC-type molybdate transport system substrate-binding protein